MSLWRKISKALLVLAIFAILYVFTLKFGSGNHVNDQGTPLVSASPHHHRRHYHAKAGVVNAKTEPLLIQIASDLHIEFYDSAEGPPAYLIEPKAPILALVGDIGYACTDQLRDFLLAQCDRFEHVLFLAGNHEDYNRGTTYSMTEQNQWMRSISKERENLHYLEKDSMMISGVLVLGTTLWSDIPNDYLEGAEQALNDYRLSYDHQPGEEPRRVTSLETRDFYRENLAWLEHQIFQAKQDKKKVLVLTHHTPLLLGTSNPRYDGNNMTHCFSSDLKSMIQHNGPPVLAWACGHTHYNFDLDVGNVRVVSNQRGYMTSPKEDYQEGGIVLEVTAD